MAKTVFRTTAKKDGEGDDPVVAFEAGVEVFAEGDTGDEMFIIQVGKVEVVKQMGGADRRLAILEKGDFFGEMALLEEKPRSASIRTMEATTCLRVSAATFSKMVHENPEIVVRMMRKMSGRVRSAVDELDRLASQGSDAAPVSVPALKSTSRKVPGEHRLVSEDGSVEFRLSAGSETTVGRRDPETGVDPDIDLSPVDHHRSISRAHAKVYHRGAKFFAREEIGASNGTFINDERLETGVPAELHDGDRVRFGLVKLVFRVSD